MKFLKKLITGFRRHWLVITPLLLILLLVPHFAFAEESKSAADVIGDMVVILNTFFQFLQFLLYPLLMIIAALMDNEMLIGPAMENKLRLIWVEIRNWVNIAFVLIMVGIAFYNVMGIAGDGSNYALKSILPKIVIGLVAVNFSFLAGKIMIDSTAVLTNAVYALPSSGNLMDWDEQRDEMRIRLCKKPGEEDGVIVYTEDEAEERNTDDGSMLASIFCATHETNEGIFTGEFNAMGNNFFNHFGQHNVSVALMVQMGNAADLQVPKEGGAQGIADLSFSLLFNIFLFVMFGFAYAALAVVLIARVIVLWICLALSPLAVLIFIFPDLSNAAGGGNLDIKEKFFGHLFVPLVIGVVFSIGFTMLAALKGTSAGGWLGQIGDKGLDDIGTLDQAIELGITFGNDLSNFQDLLIAIAAVLIIWMGTFAAAEKTVANSITSTIKGAGESTGKFIAKLPAYATVIPGKFAGEDDVNVMQALGGIMNAPKQWESKMNDKSTRIAQRISGNDEGIRIEDAKKEIRDASSREDAQAAADRILKDPRLFDNPRALRGILTQLNSRLDIDDVEIPKEDSALSSWARTDSDAKKLFGDDHNPTTWGDPATIAPDTPAADGATPEATAAAAKAQTDAIHGVVSPTAADGNPGPKKSGKLEGGEIGTVDNALRHQDLTVDAVLKSEDFDNSGVSKPEAERAFASYRSMGTYTEREAILKQVSITDGKISTRELVDAVTAATTPTTTPPADPAAS